jgi:hypothetical protein
MLGNSVVGSKKVKVIGGGAMYYSAFTPFMLKLS